MLRLYTPAPFSFAKRLNKNVKLGKYKLRKGDSITNVFGMRSLSNKVFEDPRNFRPERFNNRKEKEVINKKVAYNPFA